MKNIRLMPLAGMNTVYEDAAMLVQGDAPRMYLRDAVNLDITPAGRAVMRPGVRRVSEQPFRCLWQSPLHGDVFGVLGDEWGRVDQSDWSFESLAVIGEGPVSHEVLNNLVLVAGPAGLFTFNGTTAARLQIDNPPAPLITAGAGSLPAGTYGVAVAWLRGQVESGLSEAAFVEIPDNGALEITFPLTPDNTITGVRVYATRLNGGELLRAGDFPLDSQGATFPLLPELGAAASYQHLSPMPTGRFLKYWRGRLLLARANVVLFSEAMAYHLHNERHGFVQMPQRITFLQPVDGGIWVGQVDHVAFLSGSDLQSLAVQRKRSRAPVPGTALLVEAAVVGGELAQGGGSVALWLAENGHVAGTPSGELVELHGRRMSGITAQAGASVVLGQRVFTAVS